MKENYQIYLPYQFHWRPQSALGDSQLPNKKMKTLFLSNMSKSRRLTSTFFPIMNANITNALQNCKRKYSQNCITNSHMTSVHIHRAELFDFTCACYDGNKILYRSSNNTLMFNSITKNNICSLWNWCTFMGLIANIPKHTKLWFLESNDYVQNRLC